MSVTVTGILRDSGGNPAPNKVIKFYTTKGFDGALPSATLEVTTSGTGQYNFELSTGIHILSVQYNDSLTKVNKVTVTSDMPSPQTLDSLLAFEEPLLPDEIIIVQGLVAEANAAAVRAETAASSVEGIEAEVEADRQEVANNTAEVAADTVAVADARQQIDTWQQEVSDNATQVATDTADVTAKAAQVSADAAQVAADALSAEEDALLSQMWAVGSNPDSTTPSDTNNSKYWSDRAAQFATGALIYGGQFTPTVVTPYPPTTEIDTMYLVNFPDPESTFTYADGDLSDTTVKNGNAIIYNTPENKFEAQSYVFTGVATVNGKSPDGTNNVTINAADVGAYSTGEVDLLLGDKADKSTTYTDGEVDNLIQSLQSQIDQINQTYEYSFTNSGATVVFRRLGNTVDVFVDGSFSQTGDTNLGNVVPEGYRPQGTIVSVSAGQNSAYQIYQKRIQITSGGSIIFAGNTTTATPYLLSVSYATTDPHPVGDEI